MFCLSIGRQSSINGFFICPTSPLDTSKGAAEQKARSTYEYLIDLAEDPDVLAPLRFLREREVVHFQRFGEALEIARDHLNQKHWFFK